MMKVPSLLYVHFMQNAIPNKVRGRWAKSEECTEFYVYPFTPMIAITVLSFPL
jgi:hypothetical protein